MPFRVDCKRLYYGHDNLFISLSSDSVSLCLTNYIYCFDRKKQTKATFLIFFKMKKAKSNTVYCNLIFKRVEGDRSMVYITENTLSLEITEGKYNALSLYVHINVIIYLPAWNKHINKIIWQKTGFTKIHVLTGLQFIYIYIYH